MSTQFEEVELASYATLPGEKPKEGEVSPSAVRWFFNPAAKIDVRDRVTGNEVNAEGKVVARSIIKAGTLVPFRDTVYNAPRPKDQPPMPGSTPQEQRFVKVKKTAFEIADEVAYAYADTGAIVIDSLTGIEDEKLVRSIFRLCVGPKIKVATDPMLPGEKIPVIPAMLEYLNREAPESIEKAFAEQDDPKLKQTVEETRRLLIAACNAAVSGWARFNTQESRKSIADRSGGHPGKSEFDSRDRRAFAALGESIPTDIQATDPTLAKAVELLIKKELQPQAEDPRIAMLEKALAEQREQFESRFERLSASVGEIALAKTPQKQSAQKP